MNTIFHDHLVIMMTKEHYNSLSMIRSLGKRGINPIYIAIKGKGKIASSSKYVSICHYVDSVQKGYEILIEEYGNMERPPFVLFTDDETVGYVDMRYEELEHKFIFFNAGTNGRINEFMDKYKVLELAKKHGLKTLNTVLCNKGEIPNELEYPIITKSISPLVGGWKSDVFICENEDELRKAYTKIQSEIVILQKYINKQNEYCLEGFSINHGEQTYFSISVIYNYLLRDYYSPYLTVEKADNQYINSALSAMLKEIGFEGLFEIEFLIDRDGTIYFDEINFRNSPWSYPSAVLGKCLPELWMKSMLDKNIHYIPADIPPNFTAMIEPVDYAKRVEGGMITQAQWLYEFKHTDVTFYYDNEDPAPYYLMMENRKYFS